MSCFNLTAILLLFTYSYASEAQPHVCIIGAGISAASASHFLKIHTSGPNITVFEKTNRSGGRIATTCPTTDSCVEAGASIIAADNSLMRYFVDFLNLTRNTDAEESETLGLWDGNSFVFRSHPSSFRSLVALVLRYRFSLFRMKFFVKRLLNAFAKLYPESGPSGKWKPHKTVESLFARAPVLYEGTKRSFLETSRSRFSSRFINEMIAAITRVNYGQDVEDMNAMAGSVGLAGSGGGLWSVKGGNEQVVAGLLKHAEVNLHLETRITQVDKSGLGYDVTNGTSKWFCDAVIMAVPAEVADIKLPLEIAEKLDVGRRFHKTVATFVRGVLNKETFGVDPPEAILTTSKAGDEFTSVATKHVEGDAKVFKVFSRESLTGQALKRIFQPGAAVVSEYSWLAYPKYSIPEKFASFDVAKEGTFIYTSPIESAGSAMEMSAIAGANAAALIRERLQLREKERNNALKEEL